MNAPQIIWEDPIAYRCSGCKEQFDAEDAIHDFLMGEGYLDLCPFCNSEDLTDLYDFQDPENIEEPT